MRTAIHSSVWAARLVGQCERRFDELGVSLRMGVDFKEYFQIARACGNRYPSRMFDPAHVDLLPEKAFWVVGFRNGETLFIIAIRLDDLGAMSLADFLRRQLARLFPNGEAATLEPDTESQLYKIRGRVAYHGELWVAPPGRGEGIGPLATRYTIILANLVWQPDWIVGIVYHRDLVGGLNFREGYWHSEPLLHEWRWAPDYMTDQDCLVYMDQVTLRNLMRTLLVRAVDKPS